MSNARYFADGVDFWRIVYEGGLIDGPYSRLSTAKGVATRNWHRPLMGIQKLGIVKVPCPDEDAMPACLLGLCFGHGYELGWEYI